jgi:predicted dehydrogenase
VGSRHLDTAEAFAAKHGIPRAYGSWAELAADPDVDVVYVATPHSAHHPATHLCLSAGKPVLCEKPFTLDRASAADIVETARERGLFLMEAMWTRTLPAIRRMREVVADGAIGEVTAVYADFAISGPFPPTHRVRARELGGGALLDLGVYPVAFAHMFLGVPRRISALAKLTPEGVDENTAMVFEYDSGALATLHCGIVNDGPVSATVVGTRGRIVVPESFFNTTGFTLVRDGQAEQVMLPRRGNGLGYEAEEVMACLAAGRTESDLVPLSTTLEVMGILDEVRAKIGVAYPV